MTYSISDLNNKLSGLYDGLKFPRHLRQLPGIKKGNLNGLAFYEPKARETLTFDTVQVRMAELNHPPGCVGWRLQERAPDGGYTGPVVAVATDTEPFSIPKSQCGPDHSTSRPGHFRRSVQPGEIPGLLPGLSR